MSYTADFETTREIPVRVWLWAICEINDDFRVKTGDDITTFLEELDSEKYHKKTIYFHNLRFDGMFILYHLIAKLGYTPMETKRLKPNQLRVMISSMNQWYKIEFTLPNATIYIQDSLKKIPSSITRISKDYNLEETKGEIDYNLPRPAGYKPTKDEIEYVALDVTIAARALKIQFEQKLTKMTVGADALALYKQSQPKFAQYYPVLEPEIDEFCRKAYRGGYVYCASKYKGEFVGNGQVYDVNSMYPWAMRYKKLPYGIPEYYTGGYVPNETYDIYIQRIHAEFILKAGHVPTVQLKNHSRFLPNEYATESSEIAELTFTCVDLEIFLEHYDIIYIKYIDGYMFKSCDRNFVDYIDHWSDVKAKNKGAIRTIAKLMLNSLYGKFAKNADVTGRIPFYDADRDIISFQKGSEEIAETIYVPCACFITAWARWNLISAIQSSYDRFLYCDTDSIHILGLEPIDIEIHPSKLGAWKLEAEFVKAKYLHAKCYAEEYSEEYGSEFKVVVAGMPENIRPYVNWDNFKGGTVFENKLVQKSVAGGALLVPTTYQIKEIF